MKIDRLPWQKTAGNRLIGVTKTYFLQKIKEKIGTTMNDGLSITTSLYQTFFLKLQSSFTFHLIFL